MRRTLTVALVLAVTLTGATASRAEIAAQPAADRAADTGGGIIRNGPFINTINGPALTEPVPATADIFLAGRSAPFSVKSKYGLDLAARNGPACLRLGVGAGTPITVSTRYGAATGPSAQRADSADGFLSRIILAGPSEVRSPRLGLSSLRAPLAGLVGVFIGARPNTGPAPRTLNFTSASARDAVTVRPVLNQVFFIGRGVNTLNISKRYIVPANARSLCLGVFDHLGASGDNHGLILAFVANAVPRQLPPEFQPIPSVTTTPTSTATPLVTTPSETPTPAFYPTDTVTLSPTLTNTQTPTWTPTIPPTTTQTPTFTPTNTFVPTWTPTTPPTATLPPTSTPTFPPIPTTTATVPPTLTPTPRFGG